MIYSALFKSFKDISMILFFIIFDSHPIKQFKLFCFLIFFILLIYSLKYADASKLAPFGYLEIIPNILLGYYLFNDFLDLWSFIGLFIIISSGLYVIRREYYYKYGK